MMENVKDFSQYGLVFRVPMNENTTHIVTQYGLETIEENGKVYAVARLIQTGIDTLQFYAPNRKKRVKGKCVAAKLDFLTKDYNVFSTVVPLCTEKYIATTVNSFSVMALECNDLDAFLRDMTETLYRYSKAFV